MYAVIYQFKVKQNEERQFVESWKALTELILMHEGSLGSRLHKKDDKTYIAYAQWPNKDVWKNSGNNLPEEATEFRNKMRASCLSIETLHELECVMDLLK